MQQGPKGHNCTVDRQNKGFKQTGWGHIRRPTKCVKLTADKQNKMTEDWGHAERPTKSQKSCNCTVDRQNEGWTQGWDHTQ